jgi:predicted membrane protein
MSRAVSLLLALGASGVLSLAPFIAARSLTGMLHGVLVILMLGISAAFVHGVGFVPRSRIFGIIVSPIVCWPLILLAAAGLLLSR